MPTDTRTAGVVTQRTQEQLDRDARLLRESLTRCRRDVSVPLKDEHVRNLIKRIENDRAKPLEHVLTVLRDAFDRARDRDAARAAIDGFWYTGLAITGDWYEAHAPAADLPTLIRLETEAQAVADMAEIDLALGRSPKTIADAAERLRQHLVALDRLTRVCEHESLALAQQRSTASASTRRVA